VETAQDAPSELDESQIDIKVAASAAIAVALDFVFHRSAEVEDNAQ